MLEYPESHTIARQLQGLILGKTVVGGEYLHPNANIFNPEGAQGRYANAAGGRVLDVAYHAPEIYVTLDNGQGILFRQGGGKILYHASPSDTPKKYNFRFPFACGGSLTYTVRLWSYGVDVIPHEAWAARKQQGETERFQPLGGSFESYLAFVQAHPGEPKQPIKTYLTKTMAGIMSSFAGEILLQAGLHPSLRAEMLDDGAHRRLYGAMVDVLSRACAARGRSSETDVFGNPGQYLAMSERKHIGAPCPLCAQPLEKISVGGVIAFCPRCQKK